MPHRNALPLILTATLLAGCATAPRPQALSAHETRAGDPVACERVTGSRIQYGRRAQCEPVGYPFQSYSLQQL